MIVQFCTHRDIQQWMTLVRKFRFLFPGLETKEAWRDHQQVVLRCMEQREALCIKTDKK